MISSRDLKYNASKTTFAAMVLIFSFLAPQYYIHDHSLGHYFDTSDHFLVNRHASEIISGEFSESHEHANLHLHVKGDSRSSNADNRLHNKLQRAYADPVKYSLACVRAFVVPACNQPKHKPIDSFVKVVSGLSPPAF